MLRWILSGCVVAALAALVGEAAAASDWPSAANTGVPAGTALTVTNGGLTISQAGQVVSGLDIRGPVFITANDVTLMNSKITAGGSGHWIVVRIADGVTGTVIKNCTVDGLGTGPGGAKGIQGSGTFIANNISGVEDGIQVMGRSTIQDNYVHHLKGTQSPHYDGIQIDGGVSDVVIRHNTVINEYNQTSAVMINNNFGPVSNVTVDSNLLVGGGYTIYVDGKFNSNPMTGISITNNHMGPGVAGPTLFRASSPPVYTGNVNDGASLAASLPITR